MKLLYIAEITGKAGIACCKHALIKTKNSTGADFIIAGADGATNGAGLGRNHAVYLRKMGIDVLTTGDCCFYKQDLVENLKTMPYVLRPDNLVADAPGTGWCVYKTPRSEKIAVASLMGQSHLNRIHAENPFQRLPLLLDKMLRETQFVVIDFHAEASAETNTVFALAAGRSSAVIGSHNRVMTADARIIDGTAVITCAGRTGSIDSVGGCAAQPKITEYISGIPDWSQPAWDRCELQAVLVEMSPNGRASSIKTLRVSVPGLHGD